MIAYDEIKTVELELSSYCNAACPLCPRNLFGYPHNTGYNTEHLSLVQVKKILSPNFLKQLKKIIFEGNFGDFAMNPESPEIVNYFLAVNPNIEIEAHTNGGVQKQDYWKKLTGAKVFFCLDGLKDTHEIYRRNTDFDKVIENASAFISAGGCAVWKMIPFDHNKHQIEQCKQLSKELGFFDFQLWDHGRNTGPVFDSEGNLENILGDWQGETNLINILDTINNGDILLEDIDDEVNTNLNCKTLKNKSIYIDSIGNVYPCCFMGFNPKQYGHGRWHQPVNKQIAELVKNNNALDVGLESAILWFSEVVHRWNIETFEQGRLVVCDSSCGKCK